MTKHFKSVGAMLFVMSVASGLGSTTLAAEATHLQVTQQTSVCKGVVKDATGEPVIGASVMVKGTTNGVITNLDGEFSLSNVGKGATIVISYIGYATQTIHWDGQPITVTLKEDTEVLDEVVVVGYGTQKKVNLTGSVASVNTDEIKDRVQSNVLSAVQGTVPGVTVISRPGQVQALTSEDAVTWEPQNHCM